MGKKVKQKRKREKKASEAEVPEKITKSGSVLESRKFFIKDINRLLLTSSFVLIKAYFWHLIRIKKILLWVF